MNLRYNKQKMTSKGGDEVLDNRIDRIYEAERMAAVKRDRLIIEQKERLAAVKKQKRKLPLKRMPFCRMRGRGFRRQRNLLYGRFFRHDQSNEKAIPDYSIVRCKQSHEFACMAFLYGNRKNAGIRTRLFAGSGSFTAKK